MWPVAKKQLPTPAEVRDVKERVIRTKSSIWGEHFIWQLSDQLLFSPAVEATGFKHMVRVSPCAHTTYSCVRSVSSDVISCLAGVRGIISITYFAKKEALDASQATSPLANALVFKHMRTAHSKKEKKKLRNLQFVPFFFNFFFLLLCD